MWSAASRYDVHISTPHGGMGGADIEQVCVTKPVFSSDDGRLDALFHGLVFPQFWEWLNFSTDIDFSLLIEFWM